MMPYHHLPIYRAAFLLAVEIEKSAPSFFRPQQKVAAEDQ